MDSIEMCLGQCTWVSHEFLTSYNKFPQNVYKTRSSRSRTKSRTRNEKSNTVSIKCVFTYVNLLTRGRSCVYQRTYHVHVSFIQSSSCPYGRTFVWYVTCVRNRLYWVCMWLSLCALNFVWCVHPIVANVPFRWYVFFSFAANSAPISTWQ